MVQPVQKWHSNKSGKPLAALAISGIVQARGGKDLSHLWKSFYRMNTKSS